MNSKLSRLKKLTLFEWKLVFSILMLIPVISILLKFSGYRRTLFVLNTIISVNNVNKNAPEFELKRINIIRRVIRNITSISPFRINCLKRSILLWLLLASNNIESEIIFGVENVIYKKVNPHAWVNYNGIDLHDTPFDENNYAALKQIGV